MVGECVTGMTRARRARVRLLLVLLLTTGCVSEQYDVRSIATSELVKVSRGNLRHEIILRDPAGRAVRLGPHSTIRVSMTNGLSSPPLLAEDLRVSADGILGAPRRLRMADVTLARVSGFEHDLRRSSRPAARCRR
jgi:hypothetical protein